MKRRVLLTGSLGAAAALLLKGCESGPARPGPAAPHIANVVDVHCHIFNGSDLPSVRFMKIVVLQHYPKQSVRTLDITDPDAVDGLLALLTFILGRTRAPTAAQEVALLDAGAAAEARYAKSSENEAAVIDAVSAFASRDRNAVATSGGISERASEAILDSIFSAAGVGSAAATADGKPQLNRAAAERAYRSSADIGVYLRWFALFTRYRHSLADDLAATHRAGGFEPLLLCPALIDYDHWLGENVDRSPLPAQVTVMGRLARRTKGPVVHALFGFDPLRQAYVDAGKRTAFEPLALARKAIREEGFLGIKLYPPMGFKAGGNLADPCQTFPERVVKDLGGTSVVPGGESCSPRPGAGSADVAKRLDEAMKRLFDLCVAEEACILAHANETNAAGPAYASRADPAFWIPVFTRWPNLRVCLAHFGHFDHRSAGAPAATTLPEASWEWSLGRYIRESRNANVFADVSYMSEVFGAPADLDAHASRMKSWIASFDPDCRHLAFGTDWTMLGLEASHATYTKAMYSFFKDRCGLDEQRLRRVFSLNAGRFLGLREGDGARKRLAKFYADNRIPVSRLPTIQ
jgi:predicted TIM-barrel fold metal-dependent hydrolase